MVNHSASYPYSAIPCTRQGYYAKWLLAVSRNVQGAVLKEGDYHAIKCSCLSHDNLQNMIITGDAIPLPADFAEAVDGPRKWGGICWVCWLEKSLKLMYEYLREGNMHGGVGPTKMRLFHDCILLCVEWRAGLHYETNSPDYNLVLSNWNTYFWIRCCETYCFHQLASDSMFCVGSMIQSIERNGPVTQAFNSVALNRLVFTVHVVPLSLIHI